jgi:tRNA threonylcarbamoyladenosine biosynthesis protein TsaE
MLSLKSPAETRRFGRDLGAWCVGGEVILLEGELGAGKTVLVQGLAAGLGVAETVVSPTFVLQRVYQGRLALYHFDFYRLRGAGRAVDLEFVDYLESDGVCVVEWPSCAPEFAPPGYLRIALRIVSPTSRDLTLEATDARHIALADHLTKAWARPG